MNIIQKSLLLGLVCLSGASYASQQTFAQALKPENIERFKDETCYILQSEEEIRTCAQVKHFMALALHHAYKPNEMTTIGSTAAGGLIMGYLGAKMMIKTENNNTLGMIFAAGMATVGVVLGHELQLFIGSRHHREGADFADYFYKLAQNPKVLTVEYALRYQDEMNKKCEAEKRFNQLSKKYKIVETAGAFMQYRLSRRVVEPEAKPAEVKAPAGVKVPAHEDSVSLQDLAKPTEDAAKVKIATPQFGRTGPVGNAGAMRRN